MKTSFAGLGFISAIFLLTICTSSAGAQVIPDSTLHTIVDGTNIYTVTGGTVVGKNLFHSFSQFSVPSQNSVVFQTNGIQNIFSRVTGNHVSYIDGNIKADANLFLLNPAGIIFGKNASLSVAGSFVGTTASSIKFADGTKFSATEPPLLSISVPIGLQMSSHAKPIQVYGNGNDGIVPTKNLGILGSATKTIALVGGDITLSGGVITAPLGRIEIGAVDSGTVNLIATPTGWQLDYAQVQDFRDINFTQRSSLWNPNPVSNPFGGIQVVGRDIRLDQSQIAGAAIRSGQGSNITVNAARSLFLGGINANAQAPSAWIVNQVAQGATGKGGAINIQAGNVTLQDGAAIETFSLGTGAAGKVQVTADTITATGAVALTSPLAPSGSSPSRIGSQTYTLGDGGDVSVVARKLTLKDGGLVGTIVFPGATGKGGNISVDVADEIYATGISPISLTSSGIDTYTFSSGKSGDIKISTDILNLIDGGTVLTFTSRLQGIPGTGTGNTGDISVVARKGVNIVGTSPISPTLISFLGTSTAGSGNSGNVFLTTPNLSIEAGASLGTSTLPIIGNFGDRTQSNNLGNSGNISLNVTERITITGINQFTLAPGGIGTATYGNGQAGDVKIQTNQLQILDGGALANGTTSTGNGGALTIQANDILVEGKNLRASAIGASAAILNATTRKFYNLPDVPTGKTGILNINANKLTVRNGGNVSVAHEGTGDAGELNIQANQIFLDNGGIKATTASGEGGNLTLTVGNALVIRDGSKITTEAGSNGNGGNLKINAPIILGLENSDIIANAVQGNGGNIGITTQGIFGLKYRQELTTESDITASSQFGVNGTVDINNIGVDPNSGLLELPENVTDPSQQMKSSCAANTGSSFVVTGRGGIPQNPTQEIRSDRTWSDIRDISAFHTTQPVKAQTAKSPETLVQATSWRRNAQGKIELIAEQSSTQVQPKLTCAALPTN
ncbi:S-layer family protein [Nostoc sp. FACHB-110]|uniref:two-partner secretion domain-containing protein n=1 Tax=Nostoc sp. FACHB-110 TaxID=2692834 RepID=UPI0016871A63|nr:S-layer family protein [Nostoc sp. FACHB-110]MBD2435496.1 S-layer family protein [Nostoc sp. FACHB-110]